MNLHLQPTRFLAATLFVTLLISAGACSKEEERIIVSQSPVVPAPPVPRPSPPSLPPGNSSNRPAVDVNLVSIGKLTVARHNLAVAAAGNKIVFAGGFDENGNLSARADLYDVGTDTWSAAELSRSGAYLATAVLGKRIFIAGMRLNLPVNIARVDIYDTESNTWSTADLPNVQARMVGAAAGNKVVFASGVTAHIYDAAANRWTTAPLSERPGEGYCCQAVVGGIAASAIGDIIYLAGGSGMDLHNRIDIYNTTTNTWAHSTLSEYKGEAAAIAVGTTNFWAGGFSYNGEYYGSSLVEIRDMSTGTVTLEDLFQPNADFSAVQKGNTLVFFTGRGHEKSMFDIYDLSTKTWSIGMLPVSMEATGIVTVNNTIYVAGGKVEEKVSTQVSKLEF